MFVTSESPDEMYAINVFHYCVATPLFSFCKPLFQSNSLLFMKNSEKNLCVAIWEKMAFQTEIDTLNIPKCCCCSSISLFWVGLKCNYCHWGDKGKDYFSEVHFQKEMA